MDRSTGGEVPMAAGRLTANPTLQTVTAPSKSAAAHLNAEHWRREGIALVMRRGSPQEIAVMLARQKEVNDIRRQTAKWLAERNRRAA